jgi:hypothetical protein
MRKFSDIPGFVAFLETLVAAERDRSALMERADKAGKAI